MINVRRILSSRDHYSLKNVSENVFGISHVPHTQNWGDLFSRLSTLTVKPDPNRTPSMYDLYFVGNIIYLLLDAILACFVDLPKWLLLTQAHYWAQTYNHVTCEDRLLLPDICAVCPDRYMNKLSGAPCVVPTARIWHTSLRAWQ